jgi:hypothetical protein
MNKNLKITYYAASFSVFQAFWGISGLLDASPGFHRLPDYASTMSFALRQLLNSSGLENFFVRFGFQNGSDAGADLVSFPMFGRRDIEPDMLWTQFALAMANQSITHQKDWCNTCISSNLTFCTAYTSNSGSVGGDTIDDPGSPSVSPVAAGFIGAGVTLAVVLGIEAIVALIWNRRRRGNRDVMEKSMGSEVASERSTLA